MGVHLYYRNLVNNINLSFLIRIYMYNDLYIELPKSMSLRSYFRVEEKELLFSLIFRPFCTPIIFSHISFSSYRNSMCEKSKSDKSPVS